MSFFDISEALLNKTLTENGDLAYVSTLSPCLDYFALIGGSRDDLRKAAYLFIRALHEDPRMASMLLFYTRDPRGGIGERRLFRFLFNSYCATYPDKARKLLPFIPKYGRYDDLFCAVDTPLEDEVIAMVDEQLQKDIAAKKEGKPISLLAKWLPSINTSSDDARALARRLCKKLGLSYQEYRKTLSFLRDGLIIENNLREKKYDFDYAKVPSLAMQHYNDAFDRNDQERFRRYLDSVNQEKAKMNVAVADVVTLIADVQCNLTRASKDEYYEATWKSLVAEGAVTQRTLVVRDGSYSMYRSDRDHRSPILIASAMALLTASRLQGAFHDRFITFSSRPQLVDLTSYPTLREKYIYLSSFTDCSNTNIEKVYQLVLDVYNSPSFTEDDAIDQLLIISDMEFDAGVDVEQTTFEAFDEKFRALGYSRPEVIFWNVEARHLSVPVTKHQLGVKLVSGSSKNIINMVANTDSIDPYDFMIQTMKRYEEIGVAYDKED